MVRYFAALGLVGLVLVGGCSRTPTYSANTLPSPPPYRITPPASGLAPEDAALSGIWDANRPGRVPLRLIVESVDAKSAHVIFLHGGKRPGWSRVVANVLPGGVIQFGGSNTPSLTFTIGGDRSSMEGRMEVAGRVSVFPMVRVQS